jgi:hypothetical protein
MGEAIRAISASLAFCMEAADHPRGKRSRKLATIHRSSTQWGALLRPAPDDALQEWIVSTRVNKAGVGDDDPALIEPIEHA